MKKILKSVLAILSASVLALGIASFAACSGANNSGENPKNEVTAPVENGDGAEKELKQQIADLEKEIKELQEQIKELQEENKKLSDRIENLELKHLGSGSFYTLRQAYEKGLLTKADLLSIAYYHNGGRSFNEEIMPEDFVPVPKTPEKLSPATEKAVIQSYWNERFKENNHYNITTNDIGIGESYYGTYNKCVVVKLWYYSEPVPDVVIEYIVDGVTILYRNGKEISVWCESGDDSPVIESDKEAQIKQDYFNLYGSELIYDKYCGTYGGCAVFLSEGDAAVVQKVVIADIEFVYNYSWKIIVWKEGQFKSFKEAYECGWLSYGDLRTISVLFNLYKSESGDAIDSLDEAKATEIKTAYYNLHKKDFGDNSADIIKIKYFGEYNGSYVMFIHSVYCYTLACETDIIDGVQFSYTSGHKLEVYNSGSFYSVPQAFNCGLLTHDNLVDISNKLLSALYQGKLLEGLI